MRTFPFKLIAFILRRKCLIFRKIRLVYLLLFCNENNVEFYLILYKLTILLVLLVVIMLHHSNQNYIAQLHPRLKRFNCLQNLQNNISLVRDVAEKVEVIQSGQNNDEII